MSLTNERIVSFSNGKVSKFLSLSTLKNSLNLPFHGYAIVQVIRKGKIFGWKQENIQLERKQITFSKKSFKLLHLERSARQQKAACTDH